MYESHERILKALSLESHLTARQLARLLYPNEQEARRYQRVAKNLQYLRKQGLLKSKSYGLGKEDFWSIARHNVTKDLGLAPALEVHPFKYEHEKDCAEVFVTLALSGSLYDWSQHTKLAKGIIPDRSALIDGQRWYIEVERSERDRVSEKLANYQRYYRETKEQFHVLFLVKKMRDWQVSDHYQFVLHREFCAPIDIPNGNNAQTALIPVNSSN